MERPEACRSPLNDVHSSSRPLSWKSKDDFVVGIRYERDGVNVFSYKKKKTAKFQSSDLSRIAKHADKPNICSAFCTK